MKTEHSYTWVQQWSRIQEQAGVDRDVRELFVAYARLMLDAGKVVPDFSGRSDSEAMQFSPRDVPSTAGLETADPRFKLFVASYSRMMIGRKLPVILSVSHLARKWRMPLRQMIWFTWHQDQCYQRFTIPKPAGGERIIHAPVDKIKTLQHWIARHILVKAKLHRCATGFRRGMSIVDNAVRHARRNVVVRIDLKDFFPTITHEQVRRAFEHLGYPYRVANVLANLCTLNGVLPQGAPTSPALANLVCRHLDERLYRLSLTWKCRYSRYADDLVFSSNNKELPSLIPFIKEVVGDAGFVVNEDKVRVMRRGTQQKVTGLVVNEKPNLSRTKRRLLRAMTHRQAVAGPAALSVCSTKSIDADPSNVLNGRLAFLRMVSPSHEMAIVLAARKAAPESDNQWIT